MERGHPVRRLAVGRSGNRLPNLILEELLC
jgi:hypothetical protein